MFGKILDKCDKAYLGCKLRAEKAKDDLVEETEGMETLQVVIIIIIALAVAGGIYVIATNVLQNANSEVSDFTKNTTNPLGGGAGAGAGK